MESAIHALDEAVSDYREADGLMDAIEEAGERLAAAAEAVLNKWDFDRGIPLD